MSRPVASFQFHRKPGGVVGCTVGLAPHVFVGAYSTEAADALSQAGHLAAQIQALAKAHPEMAAAVGLVPGGAAALSAISAAAALYNNPNISARDVASKVGPAVAGVVKDILSIF